MPSRTHAHARKRRFFKVVSRLRPSVDVFPPDFDRSRRIERKMARRLKSRTKSREARGYGPAHRMRRRMLSPRVEAGLEYCARCGERILEGEPWDLGHDDYDRRLYLGPEHRRCNRSAAGRKSAELQRCKTSREW